MYPSVTGAELMTGEAVLLPSHIPHLLRLPVMPKILWSEESSVESLHL